MCVDNNNRHLKFLYHTTLKTIAYEEILNVDILQYEDIDVEIDEVTNCKGAINRD